MTSLNQGMISTPDTSHLSSKYIPRPLQADLHAKLKRFNVVVCHRRFGKCRAVSEEIPTTFGMKKLGDITVEDKIFGHDGNIINVLAAYDPFEAETFSLEFDSGFTQVADAEHLWYVEKPLSQMCRTKRDPWEHGFILTTAEIMDGLSRGEQFFIPTSQAKYPSVSLPLDPYWFGYWLGNGSKSEAQVCINNQDEIIFPYEHSAKSDGSGCYYLHFGFQGIKNRLRDLGVLNNKHIPDVYKFSSVEQRFRLIQGMMDSDGTVSNSGTSVFDQSQSVVFSDFVEVCRSLGCKVNTSSYERKGAIEYRAFISGNTDNLFTLKRKKEKQRKTTWPPRHQILNINPAGKQLVRCLKVSDPKELFLMTRNYVATHNTVFALNHMISHAFKNRNPMPRYAYVAPSYGQAKRVCWSYLKHYTANFPGVDVNEADLRVDIKANDARIMLLSAENPTSLKGIYLDGVILDEFAEMSPDVWFEVIRPTLTDRKGWSLFIGTPKGRNNFFDLYSYAKDGKDGEIDDEWFSALYKASETNIIDADELKSNKKTMTPETYDQEFECSFDSGIVGAYFTKEIHKAELDGRVINIPVDDLIPVDTYWDLGMDDATAIWFVQTTRFDHRVIDYIEVQGLSIPESVNEMKKKGYNLGAVILPHDAQVRDLSTGKSRVQMFDACGCRDVRVVPRVGTKQDSINAARVIFSLCYFDKLRCKEGLEALANYKQKWDAKKNVFQRSPEHSWASHAADAFQTFALGVNEDGDGRPQNSHVEHSLEEAYADMDHDPFKRWRR